MTKSPVAEDDPGQSLSEQLREDLQNAFSFVEGRKSAESFAALTPEDCIDQFIERIEGKGTQARPNALDRLSQIQSRVKASISQIRELPPEAFRNPTVSDDVNSVFNGDDLVTDEA